jgi:carboxyl-terminal processing protease
MALVWDRYIENLIDNDIPGLIIDMRVNGGGNSGMAASFVGYFFDEEITYAQHSYYNHLLGEWEYTDYPSKITPGPMYYDGPIVILVSPSCVSACEGFTYQFTIGGRATIVGHAGTAGAYGDVGRGQYDLPGDISLQFPTGRTETMDGKLFLEGTGVLPDVVVPVTYDSALGNVDLVLQTAIDLLLGEDE